MRIILFDISSVYEPGAADLERTYPLTFDQQPDGLPGYSPLRRRLSNGYVIFKSSHQY